MSSPSALMSGSASWREDLLRRSLESFSTRFRVVGLLTLAGQEMLWTKIVRAVVSRIDRAIGKGNSYDEEHFNVPRELFFATLLGP